MFFVIPHCNGEIESDPILVFNDIDLFPYLYGEYLIYFLEYMESEDRFILKELKI